MIRRHPDTPYSPLFFLAALGAGGAAISFYIYLVFMVEHADAPLVTIDHLWPILRTGDPLAGALSGMAILAMLFFAGLHLRLLIWNLVEFARFRHSEAYRTLRGSGTEISLLAIPLTLAMTVHLSFLTAMILVPGLWQEVERVFPIALALYLAIGGLALFLYLRYLLRIVRSGSLHAIGGQGSAQMLAVFAFAMVAMGLASPGCMSDLAYANVVGGVASLGFAALAAVLATAHLALSLATAWHDRSRNGTGPTLWVLIPVLTLLGIVAVRIQLDPLQGFDQALLAPGLLALTGIVLVVQLLIGVLGYLAMHRTGYLHNHLDGEARHPGSYALVCPGIALFVFGMYFVSYGLVKTGLLEGFSGLYFALLTPLAFVQYKTIRTMLHLNRRLLGSPLAV